MGISGPDVGTDPGETEAAETNHGLTSSGSGTTSTLSSGRIVTNNAATTQSPASSSNCWPSSCPATSVHRGRSTASG